jgi:DNA-binding transcriptional regulator YiaG
MKTKIEKNYTYTGLGFPVKLKQVEMVLLGNEWLPKIDVKNVANIVVKELAIKATPLTGNEIHFIRTHFGMSLREFGAVVVHEGHTAVKKWEDYKDKVTRMNTNTEIVIRNFILEQTSSQTEKQTKFYARTLQAKIFAAEKSELQSNSSETSEEPIYCNSQSAGQ